MAGVGGQTGCPTTQPAFRGFEPLFMHHSFIFGALFPSKSWPIHKHIVKHIVKHIGSRLSLGQYTNIS
jgi:hypothetical protein